MSTRSPLPRSPRARRMLITDAGPVPCLVVRSPRARRLTLRVTGGEVRLTVPTPTSERDIRAFLETHREWVAERVTGHRDTLAAAASRMRTGTSVSLFDQTLHLDLTSAGRTAVTRHDGVLRVAVRTGDDPEAALERWYRAEAHGALGALARRRADALGLRITGIGIRDPRSRWGSCSAAGRLSFSWRLLLAPLHVAEHVVAHEVCHLRHLDHSHAFWALLREVDPGTDEARRWLRSTGHHLHLGPAWRSLTHGAKAGGDA